ncbi:MAG: isopentenyl phosphate kinase [Desulfurococcaceae archaeon]|nr:isopentenyl phosphate kinase [Sulfolobales archaeon]MDW8169811.1 isopentenyl phosphate kinase [Desulfurococcaceae archaeon]
MRKVCNKECIFVKAGGSWITFKDKPFSIDYSALKSLANIMLRVQDRVSIVLGHGGGSFAHPVVNLFSKSDQSIALVQCNKATRTLNNLVSSFLAEAGVRAFSMQTSAMISCIDGVLETFAKPVIKVLSKGLIPIVYGDCIACSDSYKVASTEEVFKALSKHIKPSRIVFLERVSGVYTKDPLVYRDAELIPVISRHNYDEVKSLLTPSPVIDVTGGMLSKIEHSLELSRAMGIKVIVVSGFDEESSINAIVSGESYRGTTIVW